MRTPQLGQTEFSPMTRFAGGGVMGALTREKDWASTPVGRMADWPQSLKTAVSICLGSRHPIVIWWGKEHLTQFYNDGYISFLGASKHPDALGQSARQCWREIWHIIDPMLENVFTTGEATWSEDFLYVIDRNLPCEEGYFTFSYSPIRDDIGSIEGIFCACSETTGRVVGERRLRTLRDLSRLEMQPSAERACELAALTLSENPADIPFSLIYLLDDQRRFARLAATNGVEVGSSMAPPTIDLQNDVVGTNWPLRQVLQTGESCLLSRISSSTVALSGGPWPEPSDSALVAPIPASGQAAPAGILVCGLSPRRVIDADYQSFVNLAARHIGASVSNARAYAEERKRVEALAEIDRAKTLFFSNVSHEFRTPLTLMLGPLEGLIANANVPAVQRESLDVVYRNSLRLLKLVNSLLDFSRIEAGRSQASYEPTDIATLTSELASNFRTACQQAGLRLIIDCPPLPELIYVDRDMWEKIVLNLISNAFKFTFDGEIAVRLRAVHGQAELSVCDSGVGIADHELPRLFERFHRIEGQKSRTFEGSGIGLALVQELVKLQGGKIRAESEIGRGTKFTITVPFGAAHLPPGSIGAERKVASTSIRAKAFVDEALRWLPEMPPMTGMPVEENLPTTTQSPPRARIIVADDNADMRGYVRSLLEKQYLVETVADGRTALDAIRARRPDLLLADIMMPQLDGFGLLSAIRSDPELCDLPVIVLSGRAGEESRIEGLQGGADDYLIKPFSARELVARVSSRLELSRVRREGIEAQRLLLRELAHRVKNTLANVQAIAQHTLRQTKTTDEFAVAFSGRLQSLSRAHSLLSDTSWQGAALHELIRNQLVFDFSGSRIDAAGPLVTLNAQTALHVALILHELGTNAAKYGALSNGAGKITIRWSIDPDGLRLKWKETGGPRVKPIGRRGFGMTLIEQSASGEHGSARMSANTDGVSWEITFPIDSETAISSVWDVNAERESAGTAIARGHGQRSELTPRRILVVEDEPLIALDVVAGVEALGLEVVGPASSAEKALDIIESKQFDGALLDANLAGRPVDDIADALASRKIPFIFVTGYNRESLPQAFRDVMMLCKPFSRSQLLEALRQMGEVPDPAATRAMTSNGR